MGKTLWQKIHLFFGFWHYYELTSNGLYKVTYWRCLPWWGKFFRKFDLFRKRVFE